MYWIVTQGGITDLVVTLLTVFCINTKLFTILFHHSYHEMYFSTLKQLEYVEYNEVTPPPPSKTQTEQNTHSK